MTSAALGRRGALGLGLAGLASIATPTGPAGAAADLSNVTLRVATLQGSDELFLPLAGLSNTPYKVEYHAFNSGQLDVEAINAGAIDFGSWRALFQAKWMLDLISTTASQRC